MIVNRAMRFLLAFAVLLVTGVANARSPDEEPCDRPGAARFEVAPWLALGGGVRRSGDGSLSAIGTVALDVGVTVPVLTNLRVGAWGSPGTSNFTSFDAAGGGRIELQSNDFNDAHSNFFGVRGRYTLLIDGGAGHRFGREGNDGAFYAIRIAGGFTAPNLLYHLYQKPNCDCTEGDEQQEPKSCRPTAGVIAGARPFVSMHRAVDGSRTEITAGIEFEAIGAGWWILAGL